MLQGQANTARGFYQPSLMHQGERAQRRRGRAGLKTVINSHGKRVAELEQEAAPRATNQQAGVAVAVAPALCLCACSTPKKKTRAGGGGGHYCHVPAAPSPNDAHAFVSVEAPAQQQQHVEAQQHKVFLGTRRRQKRLQSPEKPPKSARKPFLPSTPRRLLNAHEAISEHETGFGSEARGEEN